MRSATTQKQLVKSHCDTITSKNAGTLRKELREEPLPSGDISYSIASHRGAMQSFTRSMLQELQHQRAPEAGAGSGGDRTQGGRGVAAASGGGSGVGGGGGISEGSASESKTSFPFPSKDLPSATGPSPFYLEDARAPWEPPHDTSRGVRGAQEEAESPVIRSGVGQRSSPPPSRASILEAVAPQLLAQSSSIDANIPLPTPDSVEKYRAVQRASTTAHILTLLSPNSAPTIPETLPPFQLISEIPMPAESPIVILSSNSSKHSASSDSTARSKTSTTSSFAYQMRHNTPDLRLLRQRSKPPQHIIQKPSILKIPGDIKRSPSFFRPKVISDTAIVVVGKAASPVLAQPTLPSLHTLPEILRAEPPIKSPSPITRVQTLAFPALPLGKMLPPLPMAETEERIELGWRNSATKDFAHVRSVAAPDPVGRQVRLEDPMSTERCREEPPSPSAERSRKSSTERSRRSSSSAQPLHHRHRKNYHAVSPLEEVLRVTPLHRGDSYLQSFQTFQNLPDVTSKEFVPIQTPPPQGEPKKVRRKRESEPVPLSNVRSTILATHLKSSSEATMTPTPKRGKQSNVFGFLRKHAKDPYEQEELLWQRAQAATSMGGPVAPGILVHASEESHGKRRMSSVVPEMQINSYFNRPRVHRLPSDNSLSPTGLPTPLSNITDDPPTPLRGKGRARYHNRSSSDQLSPLGTPRASHRPTMESLRSRVSQTTLRSTSASQMEVRRARTNKSDRKSSIKSATKGNRKGSVKFVDGPDLAWTDLMTLDRNQTAMKGKPSNYFVDIRKVSSADQLLSDGRAPSEPKGTRRWRQIMPKFSSMSLSRISLGNLSSFAAQKLHPKSSRLSSLAQDSNSGETELGPDPSPPSTPVIKGGIQPSISVGRRFSAAQLEVTDFEQTPFSQRYHDSERALQQQIRAFIDEALNQADDAEGDDELVFGFEQDVPDHFPTSPLCPLYPKHKSGGKAICPLHGRYKKGLSPPSLAAGKRPVGRVSSSGIDPHAGHHRIEIVLDTAIVDESPTKETKPASVNIFGVVKEDHHMVNKVSTLGVDGAVSVRNKAKPVYSEQTDLCRGRRTERDLCGSERKRRRRVRMRRA